MQMIAPDQDGARPSNGTAHCITMERAMPVKSKQPKSQDQELLNKQAPSSAETSSTESSEPAPASCLAEQLGFPWRSIVMNPINTFLVYAIGNSIFCSTWLVLRWIIHLVTAPGFFLLVFAGIFAFARYVAIALSYPGHLQLVIRDGEQNFARITKRRIEMFMEAANELMTLLRMPNCSTSRKILFMQAFENYTFASDTMLKPLLESLQWLAKDSGSLTPKAGALMALLEEIWDFHSSHLIPICRELVGCSSRDFDDRKRRLVQEHQMQLIGAKSVASAIPKSTSSDGSSESSSSSGVGQLVHGFMMKLDQLTQLVPHLGAPEVQVKRGLTWLLKEYLRPAKKSEGIANLDLMRADLASRFNGEQVWIRGYCDEKIDGMFLPAAAASASATSSLSSATTSSSTSCRRTVLLCNPNGALYEFHHFQTDWIRFYLELGCNVFVYNYRGYGRNKGSPSPFAHNYDGLAIVDYLKHERQSDRIVVHGESIGGLVATFVAKHSKHVDVLIADRTFSSLPALAERLIASWAGKAMGYVTNWETDNVTNFLDASCGKILCSDPNDEIIIEGASLKAGVALRLLLGEQTFHIPTSPISAQTKWHLCPHPHKRASNTKSKMGQSDEEVDTEAEDDQVLLDHDGSSPTAASIPCAGKPLTEQMILQFSEAIGSLARRSARIIRIFNGEDNDDEDDDDDDDVDDNAHGDKDDHATKTETKLRVSSPESDQMLVDTWMILARWDGLCGQMLYEAVEHGYDHIRAWLGSMLIWGPRIPSVLRNRTTTKALERQGLLLTSIPTTQVLEAIQKLYQNASGPSSARDLDVMCCLQMVEFVRDTLESIWKSLDEQQSTAAKNGAAGEGNVSLPALPGWIHELDHKVGRLLPLHCGHNRNFTDEEKQKLIQLLREVNFL